MDSFEYNLIITSVIYAMAMAQILSGVSQLAQSPGTVRPYFVLTFVAVTRFWSPR